MTRSCENSDIIKKKFELITDDMLYNIILNLRNNNMTFDDLADNLGITKDELLFYLTESRRDYFVCLESISYFENKGIYSDYSRVKEKDI